MKETASNPYDRPLTFGTRETVMNIEFVDLNRLQMFKSSCVT
jgi:hypothetical protein